MNGNLIVKNASELVTCSGYKAKKGEEMSDLKIIPDGAVVVKEGVIESVGTTREILSELEKWTKELSYEKCVLETGKRQPEAIQLYTKSDYKMSPNYGQYVGIENSICFEKSF